MAMRVEQGHHIILILILLGNSALGTPPPGFVATPGPIDEHPPRYEYGYIVSDLDGSTQGHEETRDGIYALGRYHVTLPGGSAQKVTYFADDWGYHPLVSYASSNAHGTSRTEFAVGDKAVHALKDKGSPVGNLITKGVHVINAGASGHFDQSQQSIASSQGIHVSTSPLPTTPVVVQTTTFAPPPAQVSIHSTAPSTFEVQQPVVSTTPGVVEVTTATPILSASQQLEQINKQIEAQHQQQQISVTESSITQPIVPVSSQNYVASSVIPVSEEISGPSTVASLPPPPHYLTVNQHHENYQSWQQQKQSSGVQSQLGSILLNEVPSQVKIGYHASQVTHNSAQDGPLKVQIVTPTPIHNHHFVESYPSNSISSNFSDNGLFSHEGQNIQVTSYLADTNRVLQFGDRLPAKDHQSDQRILEQIQQHAKLRIYQDLQNSAVTSSTFRPIIVTGSSIYTTEASIYPSTTPSTLVNIESHSSGESGYNSVSQLSEASILTPPPPVPTVNSFSSGYIDSNSLVEKSDYHSQHIGSTSTGYTYAPRKLGTLAHLAPLQAGLAILTAPEKTSHPVTEESYEDNSVYKATADGNVVQTKSSDAGQYQALGYEQRLVDPQARDAVREPDPIIQEQKKEDVAVQQEIELRKVQESLQELQQKIINEIDNQHEEEQHKQEAVADERQKHLDGLKKVAEITKDATIGPLFTPAPATVRPFVNTEFQGTEYLPPHHPSEEAISYQGQTTIVSESHQNVYSHSETKEQSSEFNVGLSPPPLPPPFIEIEKPVIIEKPVAIETTKFVEVDKPVLIKETVPVERTKLVEIEKSVPIPVTRVVHVDRPVPVPTPYGVPHPVPFPVAVPHAIGIPYPQYIPYTEILPIPFKQYEPIYIHTKTHHYKDHHYEIKPSKRLPDSVFKDPNPELFEYSHLYHTIPLHLKPSSYKHPHHRTYYKSSTPSVRSGRHNLKNLRIEYGGFKPPLVPSTEFTDEPQPSPYGPSVKE